MSTLIGSIMAKLMLDISDFASKMKDAESKIKETEGKFSGFADVGGRLTSAGQSITQNVTLPIVGAGVACGKLFTDFETGMAKISTVADTTAVPLEKLGDDVLALSDKSGLGTGDLQAGLYDVLSAGVKTEESIKYLEVAVKSAKGGFTDTATAVDGLTSTLNAYGLEAGEANRIANEMMVAQNLGKTTFGEMAGAIGRVAPTANALKVSTQELFSSLAVLTANGIATNEAVTGMKATFSNIAKPTKEATDAASALGIEFNADALASKGLKGFLVDVKDALANTAPELAKQVDAYGQATAKMTELEKAGKKNTDEYKNLSREAKASKDTIELLTSAGDSQVSQFATMFGSVEALNTVLTLTSDQGLSLFDTSMKTMASDTDFVDKAFNTMSDTSGNKLSMAFNKLKNAGTELGASLVPIIEKVANVFSAIATAISNLSPQQQDMLVKFALIVATVGPALMILGKFLTLISTISTTITAVKAAMLLLKEAQLISNAITAISTAAQWAWNIALTANPIGIIIVAIGALIAALVLLFQHNEGFRTAVIGVWEAIKNFFIGLWDWIKGFFAKWGELILVILFPFLMVPLEIYKHWDEIKVVLAKLWEGIKQTATTVFTAIKDFFVNIWTSIQNFVSNLVTGFTTFIEEKFGFLGDALGKILNGIKTVFSTIWDTIKTVVLGAVLLLIDLVTGNFDKFKEDLQKILGKVYDNMVKIWETIRDTVVGVVTTLKDGVTKLWDDLKTAVTTTIETLKTFLITTWENIKTTVSTTVNNIVTAVTTAWTNLKNTVSTLLTNIKDFIVNTWNSVLTWLRELPAKLMQIGSDMFTKMKDGILSTIGNIVTTVKNGVQKAIDFLLDLPRQALQWGKDFIQGFVDGIMATARNLLNSVKKIAEDIRSFLHFSRPDVGPLRDYETWMPDFMEGLAKGVRAKSHLVTDELKNLAMTMKSDITITDGPVTSNPMSTITESLPQMITEIVKAMLPAKEEGKEDSGGLTLNIENFENNREQDIEALAYELEFYRKKSSLALGGTT